MNDSFPPAPPPRDDRALETLCHLLGLAGLTGVPFANVIAPLALWLWKRDAKPSVDAHGKEAINFQISMSIYLIVAGLSFLVLVGMVLFPIVVLVHIICTILAAVRASNGGFYHYPLTIRFLA